MRAAAIGVCNGHARGQRAGTGATPKEDNHLQHVIAQNVQLFASAAQPRVQCANLPPHALSVPRVPHVPFAPVQLSKLNCVSSSAQQAKLPSVPRAPATWAWAHACCVGVGGCCVAARAESFRDTRTPRDTETLQRHRDTSETLRHFRDTRTPRDTETQNATQGDAEAEGWLELLAIAPTCRHRRTSSPATVFGRLPQRPPRLGFQAHAS